jgi:hypothetical protein
LKAKWRFVKLVDEKIDLCSNSKHNGGDACPFLPGEDRLMVIKRKITNLAPKGVKIKVTARAYNQDGHEIMCFTFPVKIQ